MITHALEVCKIGVRFDQIKLTKTTNKGCFSRHKVHTRDVFQYRSFETSVAGNEFLKQFRGIHKLHPF